MEVKEQREQFEKEGYVILKNFMDPTPWQCDPPVSPEKGKICVYHKGVLALRKFDKSVPGCSGSRQHPKYKGLIPHVQEKIQKITGLRLYRTYHMERFYFKNMGINPHTDNSSCEISVSWCINKDPNSTSDFLILKDGELGKVQTEIGDAILYKGSELKHGRDKLIGDSNSFIHQLFIHFVNGDGPYLHQAYDVMFDLGKI